MRGSRAQAHLLHGPRQTLRRRQPPRPEPLALADIDPEENGWSHLEGGEWFGAGGCAHLALAFRNIYPQMKIAVQWFDEGYGKILAHAVAWDPASGKAYDFVGTHDSPEMALAGHDGSLELLDKDADPEQIAEHMEITWDDKDNQWVSNGVFDGSAFIEWHFTKDNPKPQLLDDSHGHFDQSSERLHLLSERYPYLRMGKTKDNFFLYDKETAYFTASAKSMEEIEEEGFERIYDTIHLYEEYPPDQERLKEVESLFE
jgi:hypothetical protein